MQADKLYSCFSNSELLGTSCVSELDALVKDHPYFQAAWMLLAKAKYKTNDASYQKVLSRAAARVYSREQLYDFIYEPFAEVIEPSTTAEKKETEKPEAVEVKAEKSSATQPKEAEGIQAPKPIKKEDGEEIKSKEDLRAIVKERLAAIEEEKSKSKEEKTTEAPKESSGAQASQQPVSVDKAKRSKDEIIASFIKQNPSVRKPKDDDYSEELQIAKQSLDEQFDFVSETLALIYVKQGHKSKAKKIYNQLILKYPEKSSYFAAQIKKIES